MQTYMYPAAVAEFAPGDFVVSFRDISQIVTGGATFDEAVAQAPDALAVTVEHYLAKGLPVPKPSARKAGEVYVPLEPAIAARVALAEAMASQGVSKVALAARMGKDEKVVRRILTGKNASFAMTMGALRAVGVNPSLVFDRT